MRDIATIAPVTPKQSEISAAFEASRRLTRMMRRAKALRVTSSSAPGDTVELPPVAALLLVRLLKAIGAGQTLTVVPVHAELTTQQAADLLGVSRPFLTKQIDAGKLPSRKVGSHRRVQFHELMAYKRRMDAVRQRSLDELAAEGQKLGLGY